MNLANTGVADPSHVESAIAATADERRIPIHRPEDFEGMRRAGRLAAECLDMLTPYVKPGVTTERLDDLARDFVLDHGALPACVGYRGYEHTICTSINHVVCHGIPNAKPLKVGDIVNVDVTVIVDGWHGDTSRMYPIGEVKRAAHRLIDVTYECMMAGIAAVAPGATLADVGAAIETIAKDARYSVVDQFCGHGVGRMFHTAPNVIHRAPDPARDRDDTGRVPSPVVLREGMFFTIEPMINQGRPESMIKKDGWTAVTKDKKLSAQFEHSVGVTANGVEIFTLSPTGLDRPPYSVSA